MSSKRLSPAARLFRHSKLVSIAAPLPSKKPTSVSLSPYPTHQAITAPASSIARGDWGLKRNLPPKILGNYVRYNELDTIEHRTTFEPADDFVIALKKWQEMGLAVRHRDPQAKVEMSAFSKT